jgi:hypothetical protein
VVKKLYWVTAVLVAWGISTSASAQLVGTADNREGSCTKIANAFAGDDCTYSNSGAAPTFGAWTGPGSTGGYYTVGSTGDDVSYTPTAGDTSAGNIRPTVTVDIEVCPTCGSVQGTITYGAAARNVGTGQATRAVERWDSITHTITETIADSQVANAFGGTDYIVGSAGVPGALCLTSDSSQCWIADATPEGAASGRVTAIGTWNGDTGDGAAAPTVGIESETALTFNGTANVGTTTTAVISNLSCSDQNALDCTPGVDGSAILWSANEDPGWDNLILVVSTNAAGDVVGVEGWWTEYYSIAFGAPDTCDEAVSFCDNSYQAGHFAVVVPVPAAAWLFGSALGLLAWVRRRASA